MRGIIILMICLLSFLQVQATTYARASAPCQLSSQTVQHSKPVNQKQENQEEDEITDEDEDCSDESLYSLDYDLLQTTFCKNILFEFYIVGEANAHVNPVLTPPDWLP